MQKENKAPSAETAMLIRRPVAEVFEAFINPEITTKFWFTKSSGKLEKGKEVEWTWEMYNVSSIALVKDIVPNKKIAIEWGNRGEPPIGVEWTFEPYEAQFTFVRIVIDGFTGDADAVLENVAGTVGGFCWVLAGLKAYLEHHIQLNLVGDRFPKGIS